MSGSVPELPDEFVQVSTRGIAVQNGAGHSITSPGERLSVHGR
jgi:hypothetical protein